MRTRALLCAVLTTALLTAGCGAAPAPAAQPVKKGAAGATTSGASTPGHEHQAGMDMSTHQGMDMGSAGGPSASASMICTNEIKDAVKRTFALPDVPATTDSWAKDTRLYTCDYRLPGGTFRLSVEDATDAASGRAGFNKLRGSLPSARALRGMENFGFPAFATSSGKVAFLKDGKTLLVDASTLPASALRAGYTRRDAAYSVASAVIACWTE